VSASSLSSSTAGPPGRLLAIDSSTERLCLALQAGECRVTAEDEGGARASALAVPRAMALLREAGTSLAELDAIAFARGPGAFTGLRTACAVAQGLAFGAGKPVLPLDSLMIVAEDAWAQLGDAEGLELWVAMDARMDEVYAGAYRREAAGWRATSEPALYDLPTLAVRWQARPPAAVAGSALAAFGTRLPAGPARGVPVERDRAGALLRVAQQAWHAGAAVPADDALPVYLRDKVALTPAEREARQAAAAGLR
jgi:tRNA threonylcarbamoyladenosine biosynthesis protein TsaB